PPPARSYDCAGWRDIARRDALGALQARLSPAGAGAFPSVPAVVPGGARRRPRGRPARVLLREPELAPPRGLCRTSGTAQAAEMGRLQQTALPPPRGGAALVPPP